MPDSREKTIIQSLLRWYKTHYRALPWRRAPGQSLARPPSVYRIWLAEIMAQQTTVQAAAPFYRRFVQLWPRVQDLARAPREDVLAAWAGLGYYRRAHNLHDCARLICSQYHGRFPRSESELLRLPGIGPYTAAALCAVAFNQRVAPLDTHVTRVVARLYALADKKPIGNAAQKLFAALGPRQHAGDVTQALMDLGAQLCHWRAPQCPSCPLRRHCRALQRDMIPTCPPRPQAPQRRKLYGIVFWLTRADGKVLLRRRARTNLLAGMLEFPSSVWQPHNFPRARLALAPWPAAKYWRRAEMPVQHIFTHFELELQLRWTHLARGADEPKGENLIWLAPSELAAAALPSLMRKVAARAQKSSASFAVARSGVR